MAIIARTLHRHYQVAEEILGVAILTFDVAGFGHFVLVFRIAVLESGIELPTSDEESRAQGEQKDRYLFHHCAISGRKSTAFL